MTDCRRCHGTGQEPPPAPPPVHLAGGYYATRCGRDQQFIDAPLRLTLAADEVTCGNCLRTDWWRCADAEQRQALDQAMAEELTLPARAPDRPGAA
jgi:hypothetical protein